MQESKPLSDLKLDKLIFPDTFRDVFNEHKPDELIRLEGEDLDNVLEEISNNFSVKQLQANLRALLEGGEGNLLQLAYIITHKHLEVPRIKDKPHVYPKQYQNVLALCDACHSDVATGLFNPKIPLEQIARYFIPEQTVYAQNLQGIFQNGTLTCDKCSNTSFNYERTGLTLVLRDIIEKSKKEEELKRRVKDITELAEERIVRINPKRRFHVEEYIVNGFNKMYKTVREDGKIQYPKLYKLFEWVKRENVHLEQFHWMDELTRDILKELIYEHIPLPYAVIKMRVKTLESVYRKALKVAYDLKQDENEKLSQNDTFGSRWILPTLEDCLKLFSKLRRDVQFTIIEEDVKNYIENPLLREGKEYKAIHLPAWHSGILYSVHIKTHEMDRLAETSKEVQHSTYEANTIKMTKGNVPYQMRRAFAAILGVCESPLLSN